MQLTLLDWRAPDTTGQSVNRPESRANGAPVELIRANGFYRICAGAYLWLRPGSRDYRGIWDSERAMIDAKAPDVPAAPAITYRPEGYVYCVQRGETGSIKIGFTTTPFRRIPALDTASDVELRVLAFVPGGRALERALHRQFAEDRLRREWFKPSPRLLERIASLPRC